MYCKAGTVHILLDVCPSDVHVRSHNYVQDDGNFIDIICVIGTRLRSLILEYYVNAESKVPRVMLPALVNVEELNLHLKPAFSLVPSEISGLLESIFVEPLVNLRDLTITYVNNSKILAMDILARSVSNLRKFHCAFETDIFIDIEERVPVKGLALTEFLQGNKHLRCLYLGFGQFQDFQLVIDGIADFIPCLKVCNYLKDVTITYSEEDGSLAKHSERCKEISNACCSLRTRSLSLRVNGLRYLPA